MGRHQPVKIVDGRTQGGVGLSQQPLVLLAQQGPRRDWLSPMPAEPLHQEFEKVRRPRAIAMTLFRRSYESWRRGNVLRMLMPGGGGLGGVPALKPDEQ